VIGERGGWISRDQDGWRVLVRQFAIFLYVLSATGLAVYGLNGLYLAMRLLRPRARRPAGTSTCDQIVERAHTDAPRFTGHDADLPTITVQLPLYNEMNVVERLLGSVLALDYPGSRLVVQVLDDSSDATTGLVEQVLGLVGPPRTENRAGALVKEWHRDDGLVAQHVRRTDRRGYKAGALAFGMDMSRSEVYAIFDADFVPAPGFLRDMVRHLDDPTVGFVQARWGHLNREDSLLTRVQALAMDAHFAVEQQARFASGFFFNFNGTAGIWRRSAIEGAGGWQARTLTEDLDLSYRAQLAGWRGVYDRDVVVPGEVPRDLNALKNQQFRWAKGSLQTARLLLGQVVRAPLPFLVRLQSVIHLLAYLVHPMLLGLLVATAILISDFPMLLVVFGVTALVGLSPPFVVALGQWSLHRDWRRRVVLIPFLVALGMGVAVVSSRAAVEAFLGVDSGFVRTPKEGSGRRLADYRALVGVAPVFEVVALVTAVWTLNAAAAAGRYTAMPFLVLYVAAFGYVALASVAMALRSALGATSTE